MGRTAASFADVFNDFVKSLGRDDAASLAASTRAALLRHFNAGYRAAWSYGGVPWEDTWNDGELNVADGVINYADVDDAHVFNLWSKDPRKNSTAVWIPANTTKEGVWVGESYTSVYGFWRPVCPQFDGEDEEAEIIGILTDATLAFAQAEYWRAAGQHQTAGERRKDAKLLCDDLAEVEFSRLESRWWLRRKA